LQTTVTWTLAPEGDGTRLRMEQSGFPSPTALSYVRLGQAWARFLDRLDSVVSRISD